MLRSKLADRNIDGIRVGSAGLMPGGAPATPLACATVPGLERHISRQVSPEQVIDATLVLGLARLHVREVMVLAPQALGRVFTLKEFVRRSSDVGSRPPDVPFDSWLGTVAVGRKMQDLLGESPDDDVADPIGSSPAVYRRTAHEIEALLDRLIGWL